MAAMNVSLIKQNLSTLNNYYSRNPGLGIVVY